MVLMRRIGKAFGEATRVVLAIVGILAICCLCVITASIAKWIGYNDGVQSVVVLITLVFEIGLLIFVEEIWANSSHPAVSSDPAVSGE